MNKTMVERIDELLRERGISGSRMSSGPWACPGAS